MFELCRLFDGDGDPLSNEDLTVLCLRAEPRGKIAHCANRGVARAIGKADLAECCVALRDAGAKAQRAATPSPGHGQVTGGLAHRRRHLDRALCRIRAGHRIVEEHHDAVAGELVQRALELGDERPQCAMVLA